MTDPRTVDFHQPHPVADGDRGWWASDPDTEMRPTAGELAEMEMNE